MSQTQAPAESMHNLLRRLDQRAAREGRSRSALIREAIEIYLHDEEKASEEKERIDREIIQGYERIPPADEEPW